MMAIEEIAKQAGVTPDQATSVIDAAFAQLSWRDIDAYNAEFRLGQSPWEDAGGYWLRCLKALFGVTSEPTLPTYKRGMKALIKGADL